MAYNWFVLFAFFKSLNPSVNKPIVSNLAADYIEFTSFQGIKNAIKNVDAFLMAMY